MKKVVSFNLFKNCKMVPTFCVVLLFGNFYFAAGQNTTEVRLYNDLFTNYRSFLRPIKEDNYFKQITVNISFFLNQIESLSEKDQTLTSHGYMYLTWKDEYLTWNTSDYGGAFFLIVPADQVWLPEITPTNSVLGEPELSHIREDVRVRILSNGSIVWIPSLKWKTTCQVDVTNFPYDRQECEIHYANWMYTAFLVNFTTPVQEIPPDDMAPGLEWEVTRIKVWAEQQEDGSDGSVIPFVKMRIYMKRDPTFFELNVLLPAILLSVLMIPMFILPSESGEKTSLGVTLMLSYSIFLLMMTDVTPKSGATPRLTIVILMCTVFSGMGVFINVIIINIHHHTPEKPVPKWIKSLIMDKLGKLLCCMNYHNDVEIVPISEDFNNKMITKSNSPSLKYEKKEAVYKKEALMNLDEIIGHLEFWKSVKMMDENVEGNKDDWNKVARVLDRFMMWVYLVFVSGVLISVLTLKYTSV